MDGRSRYRTSSGSLRCNVWLTWMCGRSTRCRHESCFSIHRVSCGLQRLSCDYLPLHHVLHKRYNPILTVHDLFLRLGQLGEASGMVNGQMTRPSTYRDPTPRRNSRRSNIEGKLVGVCPTMSVIRHVLCGCWHPHMLLFYLRHCQCNAQIGRFCAVPVSPDVEGKAAKWRPVDLV